MINIHLIPIEIIEKYANRPLVRSAYSSNHFFVGDFLFLKSINYILAEVDTSESYITDIGEKFFCEPFWRSTLPKLLEGKPERLYINGYYPESINHVLSELSKLESLNFLEPESSKPTSFPMLFSNLLTKEEVKSIRLEYGDKLDKYINVKTIRDQNNEKIQELNLLFRKYGYESYTTRGYIKPDRHMLGIDLNQDTFGYEFKPFISFAPIIEDNDLSFDMFYHERHNRTKMYKLCAPIKIADPGQVLTDKDLQSLVVALDLALDAVILKGKSEKNIGDSLRENFEEIKGQNKESY